MHIALTVCVVVIAVVVLAAVGVLLRVQRLRVTGSPIIIRYLPAAPEQGWRHGTLRYDDHEVRFYRLSSLRIGPSWTVPRWGTEIIGRRAPRGTEFDIMDAGVHVVRIHQPDGDAELAFERDGLTAFQAWLESRPSPRTQRLL
ncbi:DUF2550 domain-containing protein [Tsukamurella soli]|uniref:DUF2550 domain-containing protein n=2 Tax=Tsukamurella soli TaxID=644556 RepID=A0ABP8K4U5_9ACTN